MMIEGFEERVLRQDCLLAGVISAVGFAFYLWILTRYPLIYGIDGAYYLIQVRGLLEGGFLTHGDPPLAFLIFSCLSALLGDITLGIRVGVAFFSAFSAYPLYLFVKRRGPLGARLPDTLPC